MTAAPQRGLSIPYALYEVFWEVVNFERDNGALLPPEQVIW